MSTDKKNVIVCEHGVRLRCEICELKDEIEQLKSDLTAALKRERELQREICENASLSANDEGLAISPRMMAKQRGWALESEGK